MFLDVTMQPRKEEPKTIKETKGVYDWKYENSISFGKELIDLDQLQEFKYNQWRTNSTLSNHIDTLDQANKMNTNYHLTDKLHYNYLFYSIRKQKRYGKKKTEEDKRIEAAIKKEQDTLSLIQQYYKYNIVRAKEAMKILTPDQIDILRKKQEKGGVK
ncbi:clamp loader small subunit [uncultured Caudovirales phage]|uniref:Clamp loader small subunit n=1 Tax=uncultured Caudovirales phage TaxID=2100421 RepID=A0A6J5P0P1_9CAUD|nr:clamp loader small subunit [uncultured Caudovirales phage]